MAQDKGDFPTNTPTQRSSTWEFFVDLVRFTLLAFVIVAPIRWFVAQPFIVNGASMDPTFMDGDYLIVDQLSYYLGDPTRGEVVIFKYPKDPSKYFIKRVIGLPGETVKVAGEQVLITTVGGETLALREPYLVFNRPSNDQLTLGADQYFVMGDNRPQSSDSRVWGPVPRGLIVGRALVRLYPLTKIGVHPGMISS